MPVSIAQPSPAITFDSTYACLQHLPSIFIVHNSLNLRELSCDPAQTPTQSKQSNEDILIRAGY